MFTSANTAYRSGDYKSASVQFEELLKTGNKAHEVYFNLGNSYYKQKEFAKAILNYERAYRMDPSDEDVQHNLRLAYANTIDKIEPVPLLFYERWWENILSSASPGTWAWIAISCLWTGILLAVLYLYSKTINERKRNFLLSGSLIISSLLLFFIAASSYTRLHNEKSAIIMEASAYVKSSPDAKSTNLFMLHEGTRIRIIDELEGWKQIKIANGNVGWIKDGSAEVI